MENLKEGLRWLDQAEADMKTAKDCLKDGNYYASAFFSQQAAEKALRGFFIRTRISGDCHPLSDGVASRIHKICEKIWGIHGLWQGA